MILAIIWKARMAMWMRRVGCVVPAAFAAALVVAVAAFILSLLGGVA